jgi:HAD superfamily hydrolase (TIGR01484 family)
MVLMNIKFQHDYKAIMLDVDGTLITNEYAGKISPKVKQIILKANSKVKVGIASGRPLARVGFIFDELKLKIPCVISGGTQIVDPVTRDIIWEQPILKKDLLKIKAVIKNLPYKVWVVDAVDELLYTTKLNLKNPVNFFMSKITEEEADRLITLLSGVSTLALTKVVAYTPGYVSLHITHAHATKQHAIEKVAEILHLHKDMIIGVGDGLNDLPLFKACGFRVAMGDAVPGLKAIADYIAPSCIDDGVAHIFEKFIINPYFSEKKLELPQKTKVATVDFRD